MIIVSLVVIIFSAVEVDGIDTWFERNRENGMLLCYILLLLYKIL